jgi:Prenyltransferase and squalene oxidase repeat
MTTTALPLTEVRASVERFIAWLDRYGETSWDHQSYFAGPFGRRAKALYYRRPLAGTLAVAPMILSEAALPATRRLFWKRQRFPIADAHYAMGFAFLSQVTGDHALLRRAVHFLEVLESSQCPGHERAAWGYPFDWQTRRGTIRAGTPLITTVPYVYEAFRQVHRIDKDERWRETMRSTAEHALRDYRDVRTTAGAASCAYTPHPDDPGGVVNASAYRAAMLTHAALDFGQPAYADAAARNLAFVLACQNADGSWYYATDGQRDFVDHFHTCFVLKALAQVEAATGEPRCGEAIARGVGYYIRALFDEARLPRPFSRPPRMTVYRRELYDYAECLNLATLLRGRFPELDAIRSIVLGDVLDRWRKPDGSFRSRELRIGWDNVPMHRWAQAQLFRSLCFLLQRETE